MQINSRDTRDCVNLFYKKTTKYKLYCYILHTILLVTLCLLFLISIIVTMENID